MSTIAVTPSEKKALRILFSLYRRAGIVVDSARFEELARNSDLVQTEIDRLLYDKADSKDLMAEVNASVIEIKAEIETLSEEDHPAPDPV